MQLFGFLTKFASGLRQNQLALQGDSMAISGISKISALFDINVALSLV
jgi:hypothetical protein